MGLSLVGKELLVSARSRVVFSERLPLLTSREDTPAESLGLLLAGL